MGKIINSFNGEYRFLSNFSDSRILLGYKHYKTVEHIFQAHKSVTEEDHERIRKASTPGVAKRIGRKIVIRPDWDEVRVKMMEEFVWAKFIQNPELGRKLIATGDAELIEGNNWGDKFWGVCKGGGENKLGKILMAIRLVLQVGG